MSDIPDEQRLIPLSDFTLLEEKLASLEEERTKIIDERNQLRDALANVNAGIHKASDENIMQSNGNLTVRVETWRRCRELGMDLLHIPMGGDEVELVLKLENGCLLGITQK
jgi:hypothetical protein